MCMSNKRKGNSGLRNVDFNFFAQRDNMTAMKMKLTANGLISVPTVPCNLTGTCNQT